MGVEEVCWTWREEGHDADKSGDWCKSWVKDWRTCGSFFKMSVSVSSGVGSRSCLACLLKCIVLERLISLSLECDEFFA